MNLIRVSIETSIPTKHYEEVEGKQKLMGLVKDSFTLICKTDKGKLIKTKVVAEEQSVVNADGCLVEFHAKGSQPEWSSEPMREDYYKFQGFTSIKRIKASNEFFKAASEFNALVAEEQPVGRPKAVAQE